MNVRQITALVVASAILCAQSGRAEEIPAEQKATAKWLVEQSKAWYGPTRGFGATGSGRSSLCKTIALNAP